MNVIITGASRGIGRGIALTLGKAGHNLGLVARSEEKLHEIVDFFRDSPIRCLVTCCDLREPTMAIASITALVQDLGGVDALINNAGVIIRKDIFELSVDECRAMIETNISGLFYVTRTVVPFMRDQASGHIINISSISGKVPLPGGSGYAASKYAVTGFTQSLFHEVRKFGIKVTTIFPGSVDSRSHHPDNSADPTWKVTPEEVGELCLEILNTSKNNCISEVEIRPLKRPAD